MSYNLKFLEFCEVLVRRAEVQAVELDYNKCEALGDIVGGFIFEFDTLLFKGVQAKAFTAEEEKIFRRRLCEQLESFISQTKKEL